MNSIGQLGLGQSFYGKKAGNSDKISASNAGLAIGSLLPDRNIGKESTAENAGSVKSVTGLSMGQDTASTLWQTQSFAQSPDSRVADAEVLEDTEISKPAGTSVESRFLDEMNKSPEELTREAALKQLGYSEDDLAAMSPQKRAEVEAKIKNLIEAKVDEKLREKGLTIDHGRAVTRNSASLASLIA